MDARSEVQPEFLPLAGVTVLELAPEAAGRYCGRLFALLGARVCFNPDQEHAASVVDRWLDQGKEPMPSATAWKILEAAESSARIVLVGQTPDAVLSIDREIAERKLNVLRLGITWFGHYGPYRDWIGDDALIQALIGIADGFGLAEGPPMLPQGFAPQITAGVTLFVGALAGLWGRRTGGELRSIDVDVLEASMCFTETSPPIFEQHPVLPVRRGINHFAGNHPTTVYATSDGWLGVTTLTPAQWEAFALLIGHPDWSSDERFSTSAQRVLHANLIDEELSRILATRTTDDWLMAGQHSRVPLAPVPSHTELLSTEHWQQRGSFADLPGAPGVKAPGLPFRMVHFGDPVNHKGVSGPLPLAGMRVADFSMGWAGPLCTRLLADLGADVIKVESETHYDWWRGWEPPGTSYPPKYELTPPYLIMNRNKRGVCIDLTTGPGRVQAENLVSGADLVIENYAPGVMAKLGLSADELMLRRPGLVMVSMGAFGATGPWSFFRAYGSTVEHASGMPHANGDATWPPVLQHAAYGDPVAGLYGAMAALVGLHGRSKYGGTWFDMAQVECLFQLGADQILTAQVHGPPLRLGSRNVQVAPRCVVACCDGAIALVCRDARDWEALCKWLHRPSWKAWSDVELRNANGAEIEAALASACKTLDKHAATRDLQASGVPAAPVQAGHSLPTHAHLAETGAWMRIERRFVGSHSMVAPVFHLDGKRLSVTRPAPTLGEHSLEVLSN